MLDLTETPEPCGLSCILNFLLPPPYPPSFGVKLTTASSKMLGLQHSFAVAAILLTASSRADDLDPISYAAEDIISRDVAVVGGGSSGVYTSVRLTDFNKSVVVIEKEPQLGGHAQTYTDPATGTSIDIGVVVFDNITLVTDYFSRFDVPLVGFKSSRTYQYASFETGEFVESFQPPSQDEVSAALAAYKNQLDKYPSLQGSFNMSYPVEPEILLPFGDFVEKYNLSALMYPLLFATNQGYAPLPNLTTLYMFKYLNDGELENFRTSFLTTAHHNVSELYAKPGDYLGAANVLLSSNITSMDRSSSLVKVAVQTPQGKKLVMAKKLVAAIPPTLNTLSNFDVSDAEKTLFSQFFANGYYTGLLRNTGLPSGLSRLSLDTTQPFNIPQLPGIYTLSVVPSTNLTSVYYGSPSPLPDEQVQADIVSTIKRLRQRQGISDSSSEPEWAIFSAHTPFNLQVSPEAIQDRFYEKLYALQGQRNTFYNGAAWQSQDSSVIWNFTESDVLPRILGALRDSWD